VKPGTKVGLVLEAYDPDTDKPVEIRMAALLSSMWTRGLEILAGSMS